MPRVDRFSVSLDSELLAAFDRHIIARGYTNRSEAVRDLICAVLADAAVAGTPAAVPGPTVAARCAPPDEGQSIRRRS